MIQTLKIVLSLVVLLLCACSKQVPDKKTVTDSIRKIMPPNFEVVNVAPLKEVAGLIEVSVLMDKKPVVLYMDKKAQFVFSGSLLHVESKKNLTIEAQGKIK